MKILAVTSCPTGIAHTYMAAEALEGEAEERGHELAVETQGSAGSDKVSDDAIANADVVIFAADAAVSGKERFTHLPSVTVPVARAINRAAEVMDEAEEAAESGAPSEEERAEASAAADSSDQSSGGIRQWLMTGVSYMLPFVVAGGILIALAFLIGDTVEVVNENVYENFSIAALFLEIGNTAFSMIAPILAGYIAFAMADRPGIAPGIVSGLLANEIGAGFLGALIGGLLAGAIVLGLKRISLPGSLQRLAPMLIYPLIGTLVVGALMILVVGEPIAAATGSLTAWLEGLGTGNALLLGAILGAMMAFDMGGPVNKVAYTFAVGLLSAGVLAPMAAVMAAGMTPPLGLALATLIRKSEFTVQEREAGKANWVMGASFITEGAIPFAASDPIRVIPALMVGSAVTGALSMVFDAALRAPHGGIFVFGLVDNWPLYLLAIAIGTVVTAVGVLGLKAFHPGAKDEELAEADTEEPAHA